MAKFKIVTGRSNPEFAARVARAAGTTLARVDIRNFSDGEIWVKYDENVRGEDLFIVQSTQPPSDNLFELLMLIDAARRASAKRITAVIPYFGYARQDRKDQPRVAITAKLVANLITEAGADRVITMDLHAPQIQGFFDIPFDHLYSSPVFTRHIRNLALPNLTIASPDVGGLKLARAYAKRLNAGLIFIDKRRPRPNVAEVMNIVGESTGRTVLVIDDIIDTGGTFTNAVRALKDSGATKVYGTCTHPVLSGKAFELLETSPLEQLIVTDTLPLRRPSPKIVVKSVAKLFAEAILRIHDNQSLSKLFDTD
ncbi:MAG: ribose-phosphate pyrophosphokinase [Bacteroidetes bacterium]|nr:ribose-phosphate pyrophosphokinase [Bacteroidota bacterium]HVZ37735.1 ribose-phosphate pyrophosphokinase [Candidatus Kapabacteria bacterium]